MDDVRTREDGAAEVKDVQQPLREPHDVLLPLRVVGDRRLPLRLGHALAARARGAGRRPVRGLAVGGGRRRAAPGLQPVRVAHEPRRGVLRGGPLPSAALVLAAALPVLQRALQLGARDARCWS